MITVATELLRYLVKDGEKFLRDLTRDAALFELKNLFCVADVLPFLATEVRLR